MDPSWWKTFFDADYLHVWAQQISPRQTEAEVDFLVRTLGLTPGSRILDAPCGYGRVSLPLAARGMEVVGVDLSKALLDEAERRRGDLPAERLRYLERDLREPLGEAGFDVALNLFSSIGYGTEAEDRQILRTLHDAVRPGGRVLVETIHRDALVALMSRGEPITYHLPDGTVARHVPVFDPASRRAEITYRWEGPRGRGEKAASLRIYTVAELLALLASAGLGELRALQSGTGEPFDPGKVGRVAVVGTRA